MNQISMTVVMEGYSVYFIVLFFILMYVKIFYDMIYLLTAIGLPPGCSSTVHIYTQTVHRTAQWCRIHRTYITMKIHKHKNKNTIFNFILF